MMTPSFSAIADNAQYAAVVESRDTIDGKMVLGRTERVTFPDIEGLKGVGMPAKIDTGADSTSLHAENIHLTSTDPRFKDIEGEDLIKAIADAYDALHTTQLRDRPNKDDILVHFEMVHPYTGERLSLQRPLYRLALIKSRDEGHLARPVIKLNLDIDGNTVNTEVNLANRTRFAYPLLIGKTYLKKHAWVDAGFDYLREQPHATLIGRKEQASIDGIPLAVSLAFDNKYSILHAKKIKIDDDKRTVTFNLEGENDKDKTLTLPLYKMLKFVSSERPMVYVTLTFGEQDYPILVYLRDRSKHNTQLRLGTEALNQYFAVNLSDTDLSDKPRQTLSTLADNDDALMISALESISVDDVTILATPSTTIKTPLLKVERIDEKQADYTRMVHYVMTDVDGEVHSIDKPVKRKIRIGEEVRPIVRADIALPHTTITKDIALGKLDKAERPHTELEISPELVPDDVYVNTRATHLLDKRAPQKAGYVETVKVEGMHFPAKLDTGADISSIDATDIKTFEKNGKSMVTFTYRNHQGAKKTFTREVVRIMKIKARDGEKARTRPVVAMTVTLGKMTHTVEVNLRDRSQFDYSMILGKNFLQHNLVVSSDRQFLLTKKTK
ncbi:RimK/LysX family protein [Photobacterium aphoticum]|uniref:Retropepsin-like aspartic endopeptidase domain-containing protein n=1 Tax=Photobacterium aphoticum TaxID=754436 RepID=A0A0J1JID9_9GAMM|nr:RimK/LysX family protein [Photobacterium aphoticum]KLV01722.1 hypothetical protein ABT58_04585 [Photobacterium aphoticum]